MKKLAIIGFLIGIWAAPLQKVSAQAPGTYSYYKSPMTRTVSRTAAGGYQNEHPQTKTVYRQQSAQSQEDPSAIPTTCIFLDQQGQMVYVTGGLSDGRLTPKVAMVYRNETWETYQLPSKKPFYDLAFCGGYLQDKQGNPNWFASEKYPWDGSQFRIVDDRYGDVAPIENGVPRSI